MEAALRKLDAELSGPQRLIIGGGAALALAYQYPLTTHDIDAFIAKGGMSIAEMDRHTKRVAQDMGIAPDWLNSHFESFTYVLPQDYRSRLRNVFTGKFLTVDALGPEDLLIMKCFAGRDKDRPHARKLIRIATDLSIIDKQLSSLCEKRILGAEKAADYFDDLRDEAGL